MLAQHVASGAVAPPCSLHLVEEINHRVVNEFSEAISMLSLAAARAESAGARESLANAADRLRDHAASHRALLPPFVPGTANIAEYLAQICQSFTKATLADRGVRLILRSDDIVMPVERCWRLGLVISELVRNAARHGLKGKSGTILVRVSERDGAIAALVSDDGAAAPDSSPGRGQRLTRALVADLDGTIEWSLTPDGSHARMHLPRYEDFRIARAVGQPARAMA